jgi:hypothetical protein
MQVIHPFSGTVQRYSEEIVDVNRYRPDHCPQCEERDLLTGHGFYCRTLVDLNFDGVIRVRRYLCNVKACTALGKYPRPEAESSEPSGYFPGCVSASSFTRTVPSGKLPCFW